MRITPGTIRAAITIFAVVGLAIVLLMGADFTLPTSSVWIFMRSTPGDFRQFISNSLDDYRFWSVIIILGLATVILLIQKVPMIKGR